MLDLMHLHEKTPHGTKEFPINLYQMTRKSLSNYNYFFPCHWHEECELIYLKSGKAIIDINSIKHKLRAGDLLFVYGNNLHKGTFLPSSYSDVQIVVFNESMINTQLSKDKLSKRSDIDAILFDNNDSTHNIISNLVKILVSELKQTQAGYRLVANGLIKQIAGLINRRIIDMPSQNTTNSNDYIKSSIQYIYNNLNTHISLNMLADNVGLSKYHFSRIFKENTGVTVTEYINKVKIIEAAKMLKESSFSITQIANQLGFSNVSYFIKLFIKHYDQTPYRYRHDMTD